MRGGLRARRRPAATAALALLLGSPVLSGTASWAEPLPLTGFNLAGAEFGNPMAGVPGTDYFYPSAADVSELVLRGANVFRLPFRWERLQPRLGQPFDKAEVARLSDAVRLITDKGARVIVSPHNFGRYNDRVIGSPDLPAEAFAGFWRELATMLRENSLVTFGLMNEPHDMDTLQWRDAANAAIAAIRAVHATNLILVPGNAWTGGHSWASPDYGVSNAVAMADVVDPLDNFQYEIHQYLDSDGSGTHPDCKSTQVGEQALKGVTDWLVARHHKGFLAEFGSTVNPTCLQAMDTMLYFVEAHPDAWAGWTYWGAGSWWGQNPLAAQPRDGVDPPQLTTLLSHMRRP